MPNERNALTRHLKPSVAAAAAVLAFALSGCSPTATNTATGASVPAAESVATETAASTPESATPTASAGPASAADTAADAAASAAPEEHQVTVKVEGNHATAMVKTVVVTASGKKSGGAMSEQKLPYTHELTFVEGQPFTKILVVAKYPDGAAGALSCSITVDGGEASAATATQRKPATCQFVRPAGK